MDFIKGKGTISRLYDRGGGFIKIGERKSELFFDRNAHQGVNFTDLREGQEVEFVMSTTIDGYEQVVEVRPIVKPAEDAGGDS